MRSLAHVEMINSIDAIPNADRIEVASILGWKVVVQKGEFKVGDKIVYIEIDSKVPSDNPKFAFLEDRGYKVKSIKLRKQVSQGLIMPMDILPNEADTYKIGEDVTKVLKIEKIEDDYKQPAVNKETQLRHSHKRLYSAKWFKRMMKYAWFRKIAFKVLLPKPLGEFPKWVVKSDEKRIQNCPWILENKSPMICTEKMNGTSLSVSLHKEGIIPKWQYYVCSRNVLLYTTLHKHTYKDIGNVYLEMSDKLELKNVLVMLAQKFNAQSYVTLQGEIVGEGIQKNQYKIEGHDLYCFTLTVDGERIDSVTAKKCLDDLNRELCKGSNDALKWVPILDEHYILPDTIDELMEQSTGKSQICDVLREGIVVRDYTGNVSFKCVSNEFLLKWK